MKPSSNVFEKMQLVTSSNTVQQANSFPLITSEYDAADAREVVMQLMLNNIQYHNVLAARAYESDNLCEYTLASQKNELDQQRREALDLLKSAEEQGLGVKVEAEVRISLTSQVEN